MATVGKGKKHSHTREEMKRADICNQKGGLVAQVNGSFLQKQKIQTVELSLKQ